MRHCQCPYILSISIKVHCTQPVLHMLFLPMQNDHTNCFTRCLSLNAPCIFPGFTPLLTSIQKYRKVLRIYKYLHPINLCFTDVMDLVYITNAFTDSARVIYSYYHLWSKTILKHLLKLYTDYSLFRWSDTKKDSLRAIKYNFLLLHTLLVCLSLPFIVIKGHNQITNN